jgi:hypothetical protein
VKLFLSCTRFDTYGLEIATAVKCHLDGLAITHLLDSISILSEHTPILAFEAMIADSALVCVRTDRHDDSRPWCLMEVHWARCRRPVVVIAALSDGSRQLHCLLHRTVPEAS